MLETVMLICAAFIAGLWVALYIIVGYLDRILEKLDQEIIDTDRKLTDAMHPDPTLPYRIVDNRAKMGYITRN